MQGHVHESVKMDACLTPSDAHVVGSSETGGGRGALGVVLGGCWQLVDGAWMMLQ